MLRLPGWCRAGVVALALLPFACTSEFSTQKGGAGASSGGSPRADAGRGAAAGLDGTAASSTIGGDGGRSAAEGGRANAGASGRDTGGRDEGGGGRTTIGTGGRRARGGDGGSGGLPSAGATDDAGSPGEAGVSGTGTGGMPAQDPISHDGLVYWFSADQGVNTTGGGAVSKWLDRSGNDLNAVQLSGGARPMLGTFADTALPALVFDGVDDYLGLPPLVSTFENGITFFAIARAAGAQACIPLLELSNGTEIDDINFGRVDTAFAFEVFQGFLPGQNGAFASDEPRLAEARQATSGAAEIFLNGISTGVGMMDPPASLTREQAFIGRSLYVGCSTWAGEIAELILYARTLDDGERQSIESYLESKWGCCGN